MTTRLQIWLWEWSRRWAASMLLREIQASYNAEQDARARKMSLVLDRYMLVERDVREYVTLRAQPEANVIVHYH